jgi:hypothetical protein
MKRTKEHCLVRRKPRLMAGLMWAPDTVDSADRMEAIKNPAASVASTMVAGASSGELLHRNYTSRRFTYTRSLMRKLLPFYDAASLHL